MRDGAPGAVASIEMPLPDKTTPGSRLELVIDGKVAAAFNATDKDAATLSLTRDLLAALADGQRIVCCLVTGAPRRLPDNTVDTVTIPFLPMSEQAFLDTVVSPDGEAAVDETFATAFEQWQEDGRGLSVFTVPFEGFLDRMIALQMAAIVGEQR